MRSLTSSRSDRSPLIAVVIACLAPNAVRAQVVTPRTIPVQQSGQFDIFPSRLRGMAGVSLTLDDTLLDPFVNPAKAIRVGTVVGFSGPAFHSISEGGGNGSTIPAGVLFSRREWAGGVLVAGQRLNEVATIASDPGRVAPHNEYYSALLARRIAPGLTFGISGYSAQLGGLDGVGQLYAGNDGVEVSGRMLDLRAGLLKEWKHNRSVELLLLHGKTDLTHDARLLIRTWDPNARQFATAPRMEHNDDRTRFWGLHSEVVLPLDTIGSRIGLLFTANRLTHPKIPNYPLVNIPRDPGLTHAFDLGVGIGKALGTTTGAMEIIYEPIWTTTWATTPDAIERDDGTVIPAGSRTIENWFRFSNIKLRAGLSRELAMSADSSTSMRLQFGAAVTTNSYSLRQQDHVALSRRDRQFNWTEWGPTFGFGLRIRRFEAAYAFQATCGPDACVWARGEDVSIAPTPGDVGTAVPIEGPTDFNYGRLVTHRFTFTISRR
jgi:hypothetical protein